MISLSEGGNLVELEAFPSAERYLLTRDTILARVITAQSSRWPSEATENPIWGLVRIVMAQQVSTRMAGLLAERAKAAHPLIVKPSSATAPASAILRAIGLSQRRAQCCVDIVREADGILAKIEQGHTWEQALATIKGIGPWTIAVFRIMVLRHPDVLPIGDVGLERAVARVYSGGSSVERLGEVWRPFRSVACWYLWRTLGNEQLG
jgi:DNA-3-methyladenine glycosylase II